MASILVYIESDGDRPTPESLQVIGEGRRIATTLGAALYVFAPQPYSDQNPVNSADQRTRRGRLVEALSRAGADRVALMPVPECTGPRLWSHGGPALYAVCQQIKPRAVFLAATAAGRDIAPRLAARLRAVFIPEPAIDYEDEGAVILSRALAGAELSGQVSLEDIAACAVVTLTPGAHGVARGDSEARAITFDEPREPVETPALHYLDSAGDPGADLDHARILVVAGGGIRDTAGYDLVGRLADTLGGRLAATRTLARRGIAPPDRVVGLGARWVDPEIYIACGASGSRGHLGAVSRNAVIIAINSDPEAPIFRVASYGIVGRVEQVIPELLSALAGEQLSSAPS